jgi:hypothetical protein
VRRTAKKVYLFPNGMIAAFDHRGNQIPEVQGRFSLVLTDLASSISEETEFFGWPDIVDGGRIGSWRY